MSQWIARDNLSTITLPKLNKHKMLDFTELSYTNMAKMTGNFFTGLVIRKLCKGRKDRDYQVWQKLASFP